MFIAVRTGDMREIISILCMSCTDGSVDNKADLTSDRTEYKSAIRISLEFIHRYSIETK